MEKTNWVKIILRVLLTAATTAFIVWIFSNSLKVATESAAQSGSFTSRLQEFFKVIAPNSFIATATGEDLVRLEAAIRTLAHFAEFGLLGVLCFCTYRAYTNKRIWMIVPFVCSALVAVTDEIIQYFTPGRAFEWADVLVDVSGACAGCLLALAAAVVAVKIYTKAQRRKQNKAEQQDE